MLTTKTAVGNVPLSAGTHIPIHPVAKLAEDRPLSWFERNVIQTVPAYHPGGLRQVYPGFIQLTGFMSMNLDRHVGEHVKLFQHLVKGDGDSAEQHRTFYDEFLSVIVSVRKVYCAHTLRSIRRIMAPGLSGSEQAQ